MGLYDQLLAAEKEGRVLSSYERLRALDEEQSRERERTNSNAESALAAATGGRRQQRPEDWTGFDIDNFGATPPPPPAPARGGASDMAALGMDTAPRDAGLVGAVGAVSQKRSRGMQTILARRAAEREAEEAKAIEDNTIDPDGTFDYYKSHFYRGAQYAVGGLDTIVAAGADALGLEDLEARHREFAAIRKFKGERKIRGETSGDEVWENPTVGNVLNFIAETGVQSTPQIIMAVSSIPVYIASLSGGIAQERAANNEEEEAGLRDIVASLPAAVVSAYLDRLGLTSLFKSATTRFAKTVGGRIAASAARGGAVEGATEFVQSGLEYAGGTVGTKKGFDEEEAWKQAVLGSVAGTGMGTGLSGGGRTVIEATDAAGRGATAIRDRFRPGLGEFDPAFGTAEEAAVRALANPSGSTITSPLRPRGIREAMQEEAGAVTPEDEASPLPTSLISQGRALMDQARGEREADELLRANGAPPVGSRVQINFGDRVVEGTVEDGFVVEGEGQSAGIKIQMDDGSTFDEPFSVINGSGISITPVARTAAPAPAPVVVEPGPAARPEPGSGRLDRDSTIRFVMDRLEGGAKLVTDSGGLTKYGISAKGNPGVDIANLSEQEALDIYRRKYWKPEFDQRSPDEAAILFDAAVNHGPGFADRLMAEASGDPAKMLAMRRAEYARLIAEKPAKYARYKNGWENRLQTLEGALQGGLPRSPEGSAVSGDRPDMSLMGNILPGATAPDIAIAPVTLPSASEARASLEELARGDAPAAPAIPADRKFRRNRIFDEAPLQIGAVEDAAHISEEGFAYRTMRPAEFEDAQATGAFLPEPGDKPRYGGEKQWSRGGNGARYRAGTGNVLVRVPLDRITTDAPVRFEDAEVVSLDSPAPAPARGATAERELPAIDRGVAPEIAARKLASELVAKGFDQTNGMGDGYRFANDGLMIPLPGGARPPKSHVTVELETDAGRQVFSFPRGSLRTPELDDPEAVPIPAAVPILALTPSGKGLNIQNATDEHIAAVRAALPPKAAIAPARDGSYTVSKKYEDAVRGAIASVTVPSPALEQTSPLPSAPPTPAAPPSAAGVGTQPDLLGGPEVSAYQIDAQRDVPRIVAEAREAETLGDLTEAVDEVMGATAETPEYQRYYADRLSQAVGVKLGGFDEARAYATAIRREIAPATESPGPVSGGVPASGSVSEAGTETAASSAPARKVVTYLPRDDGRFAVETGAVLTTATGRKLSPAPKFDGSTPIKTRMSLNRQRDWLLDEAIREADAMPSNSMARPMLLRMKANPKNMSPSDYGTVYDVLFGDYTGPSEQGTARGADALAALRRAAPAPDASRPSYDELTARERLAIERLKEATDDQIDSIGRRLNQKRLANETKDAFAERIVNSNPADALMAAMTAELPKPQTEDPRLTGTERKALERLLVSEKKGGQGWDKGSPAARTVADILKAGTTTSQAEEDMVVKALELSEAAGRKSDSQKPTDATTDNNRPAKSKGESAAVRAGREAAEKGEAREVPPSSSIAYGEDWLRAYDAAEREMVDQGGEKAAEVAKRRAARPSPNTIFTEEAAEKARALLKAKLSGAQLNAGLDPEIVQAGITLAGYHVERGLRSFGAYADAMIGDLGDAVRPYLRGWYEAVRYHPGMEAVAKAMSSPEDIGAALARLETKATSATSAREETVNARPAERSRADPNDRDGDERPGARDAPRAEGERGSAPSSEAEGGSGEADLRPALERGGAESVEREPESGRDGEGGRSDARTQPRGRDGNRAGRRVRAPKRASRGVNYTAPKGTLTRQGGWRATAERNLDIIELVNKLDAEGRPATAEEQALLIKFTGWGAAEIRNNLFRNIQRDPATGERSIQEAYYGDWKDTVNRARMLLKGDALESALQSTQYAHYTSETVIRSIWDAMRRFGFNGGKIMEPGMGIGLFAAAAPAEVMAESNYTGIELDAFSAKIAGYLLPQENALQADFVKQRLPDGFFDVAIGNPPFAATVVTDDPAYRKHRLVLHDYFFAKSIDKVRPGGIMVFVTSKGTMDKLNDKGRAYIAERADLLGAIRLPQTAFKDNAGTEVVTDVLFFQRRMPGAERGGESWLKTEPIKVGAVQFMVNEYFVRNPIMVLGKHAATGSMYSKNEYTVEPTANIEGQLANAINFLPESIYAEPVAAGVEAAKAKAWEADMRPAANKEGGLYVKDGKVFTRENGVGRPVAGRDKITAADEAWLKGYAGVRDALKQAQRDQLGEGDWEASLKALNSAYDAFVKAHGPIQATTVTERKTVDEDGNEKVAVYRRLKNQRLLDLDVESPLVFGLEKVADDGTVSKGQFLEGRTLKKPTRPKVESVDDAMAVTLDEIGRLDLDYIGSLMKMDRAQVIDALGDSIYHTPGGVWQTRDEYLSGDVLVKLEEAKAAADADPVYERNVTALQKVQPKPLGPQDISIKLGAGWIPLDIIKAFAKDVVGVDAETMAYEPATAEWAMEGKGARRSRSAAEEYGTDDRSPQEIMLAVLNNQTIKVTRRTSDGKTFTDPEATAAANEVANKMGERFRTWAWEDARRASALLDLYNRKFNNLAPRRFDGSHLTFPGLSAKYRLYDHQKRAIWRVIQTGNVYLAHAVGAGKTLEMIVSGMEQKRLGLIRKPMYVVPNHMLNQFAREFMEAYPAASIMVADENAFHTDNRKRFMAQASLNDPDAIIITHSSFGKLGTSEESRTAVVQKMIEELEAALEGSETRYTRAKIEKQIEALKRNFEAKTGSGKDQAVTFEEMGVDYVFVDEAHLFRKLDFATNRSVKGIDPKGSQRALDLYIKTRWLETQRPGRSLTLASGTPITNTMAEIYTVMRYMNEAELERDGLRAFDAWANMFGEVAAGYEQNAAGGYEIVERFAKFVNVPELMKRVRMFMDVLTSENLGDLVKRPKVNGNGPQSVVTPPIDSLATYMKGELKARIEASRAWKPSKDEPANPDPIIAINTDARLASIDMRFINPRLPNDPGSKLNAMIDRIIEKHKAFRGLTFADPTTGRREPLKGATQIVFSAVGFGEGAMTNRGFDLRSWMDGRLMAEAGLKKAEIAWMSDANTHAKKEALFKDMRAGRVKVLVGSPANMGTGVNVQSRLKALHFLAPPWYPADVEQPHGRIIRQGNWNEDVDLFWYATKGTYDSTAWGMVSRKARFIEQAMSGDDSVRTLEDISEANQYEMASALAAGDERIIQIAGYSSDIERLTRLQGAHAEEQRTLASDERWQRQTLQRQKERVEELAEAVKARDANAPFELSIGKAKYDKQGEAGEALIAAIGKAISERQAIPTLQVATYQGKHPVGIEPEAKGRSSGFMVTVTVGPHTVEVTKPTDKADDLDPVGLAGRVQNAVNRLPSDLRAAQAEQAAIELELTKIDRKLGAPFPQEQQLAEKIAERASLQAQLAAETKAAEEAAAKAKGQPGAVAEEVTEYDAGAVTDLSAVLRQRNRDARAAEDQAWVRRAESSYWRARAVLDHVRDGGATISLDQLQQLRRDIGAALGSFMSSEERKIFSDMRLVVEQAIILKGGRPYWRPSSVDTQARGKPPKAANDVASEGSVRDLLSRVWGALFPGVAEPQPNQYEEGGGEPQQPLRRDTAPVPARRGGSVRALGVADTVRREGTAALVGRAIADPTELAEVAQVYRDPRYETLRVFFLDGNKVVHATGVSARLPGTAPLLPKNGTEEDFAAWLKETMATAGADGFYLLHNHPSGDPTPSRADISVTANVAKAVPGFKGHVIINSNRYAVISKEGGSRVFEKDFGPDLLLKPSKPHPALGQAVSKSSELAAIAKSIQQPGFITVVAADSKLNIRAIVDYPEATLARPSGILLGGLRRIMRMSGSTRIFLVGSRTALNSKAVMDAIAANVVTEGIDENGAGSRTGFFGPASPLDRPNAAFVASHGVTFEGETEERFQAAKSGVGDGPGLIERAKGWWSDLAIGFTRHWKHLPNEPRFADLQQQFRKLEAAPEAATEEVVRRLSGIVKEFDQSDLDLFTRKVVLDDLQWEASVDHKLPFGFTPETLAVARAAVDEALVGNRKVAAAVRRRKVVNKALADEMVKAGVLTAEQIKNPAYYRHMVLEFARAEMKNAQLGSASKIKSPYWAQRMGSTLDINANLLEAEFDWMQKALNDIATARTIEWLKKSSHNIRDDLIAQAKASNKERVAALVKADTAPDGTRGEIAKADLYFRQLIARGMADVQKELLDGNIEPIPPHFQSAADALATGTPGDPPFAFMAWILDNEKAGKMGAAMVLKGVGQRKAWTREILGDKYHDPDDIPGLVKAFAPDGYAAWQPIEGQHLFTAKTITESTLDMFVGKLADTAMPGINHDELARALGSIRSTLVVGGDRYTMVLPVEVTETLNEFGDRRAAGMLAKLFGGIQSWWKRWVLINPRRIIKYNLNNISGDLDAIIAGNPGALRKVGEAAKELEAVMRRKVTPTDRYRDAVDRGVFTSGMSVQEIPDINRLSALRHLTDDRSKRPDKLVVQAAGAYWRASQGVTQWRENVFRYAAYIDYVQKLEAGQSMDKIGYGASVPNMVDAVTDPRDKAALLARDLVGDYGALSTHGTFLRKYIVPFWSWTEINTKRYWRLTSNAFTESTRRGMVVGGVMGAALAARIAAGLAIRMAFLYGLLWMWNNLLHGDDEEKLSEIQRRQLHLNLGHDSTGAVYSLRTQGALSDVIGMLGIPDAIAGAKAYERGQGTIGQAIKNTLKAPANRLGTSITPLIQVPFLELPSGMKRWPDMFDPRPIHDRWRHVAAVVSAENEYDVIAGKPRKSYARTWLDSVVYKRDPGEMAFDEAKSIAYDWMEKTKGEGGGSRTSPRSEALREYRMAIRYGDDGAANRALDEYARLGGKAKDLKGSIKRQNPLGPIPKKYRREFVESLTPEQFETFEEADQYYRQLYLGEKLPAEAQ